MCEGGGTGSVSWLQDRKTLSAGVYMFFCFVLILV